MKNWFLCMVIVLGMTALNAVAMINPNFTPIDLVDGCDRILLIKLDDTFIENKVTAKIVRVLKGKGEKGAKLTIGMDECYEKSDVASLKRFAVALNDEPVLLFVGEDESGDDAAFLHMRTTWMHMEGVDDSTFSLLESVSRMSGTWAGGTDMLLALVEYVMSDDNPVVPIHWGSEWDERNKIGTMKGSVNDIKTVWLGTGNLPYIFCASDAGDKLYVYDKAKKTFLDVSAKHKLVSKSQVSVWGDFNGDGLLDLASIPAPKLTVYFQQTNGAFSVATALSEKVALSKCTGLATVDVGSKGKAGLLVTTADAPVLFVADDKGMFSASTLVRSKSDGVDLGKSGKSLVADFDGDYEADILQLYEKGSWMYKGKGNGAFADGVRCSVALGEGVSDAAIGDFDMNGQLDVLCVAADRPRYWENTGAGEFAERLSMCGSFAYISKPGGISCGTCDINNDGRQDLYMMYNDMYPQIFFNRGFRCFGFARELTAGDESLTPGSNDGQQAGLIADVDGDGAQDFVVAQKNGEIWVVTRPEDDVNLNVQVVLPLKGVTAGPVTVTGWHFERFLGAWNVVAGTECAFFGLSEPGQCKVRWQIPGKKAFEREFSVEEKSLRIKIK